MLRVRLIATSTLLGLLGGITLVAWRNSATAEDELAPIRKATARFRDVKVALAEGYVRDPTNMGVTAEMEGQPRQLGAMGIHFFRPDILGITKTSPRVAGTGTHTDFTSPGVLIYEP